MVTHVDEISTPPTPADAPEVFEQRASQVWSDLARAVPQMNEQAQQNNAAAQAADAAAQAADAAKVRAIAEADAAMGYRNEAVAARDSAQAASNAAIGAASDAQAVKDSLLTYSGTLSATPEWSAVPAHEDLGLDAQTQAALNRIEKLKDDQQLLKQRADKSVLSYPDYAAASAAAATLPDGQRVEIKADEARNGRRTGYEMQSGVLVFKSYEFDPSQARSMRLLGATLDGVSDVSTPLLNAVRAGICPVFDGPALISPGTGAIAAELLASVNTWQLMARVVLQLPVDNNIAQPSVLNITNSSLLNLTIRGNFVNSGAVTAIEYVSGSAKSYVFRATLTDVGAASVGDYLMLVPGNTGYTDWGAFVAGCWKIAAINGQVVTFTSTNAYPTLPALPATPGVLTSYIVRTVVRFPRNQAGIRINGGLLGGVSNVVFCGAFDIANEAAFDGAGDGLQVGGSADTYSTGLNESEQVHSGATWVQRVAFNEFQGNGTQVLHGALYGSLLFTSGNSWRGNQGAGGGECLVKGSVSSGNGASGYETEAGGNLNCANGWSIGNQQQGVYAIGLSQVEALGVKSLFNVGSSLDARNGGHIIADSAVAKGASAVFCEGGRILAGAGAVIEGAIGLTELGTLVAKGAASVTGAVSMEEGCLYQQIDGTIYKPVTNINQIVYNTSYKFRMAMSSVGDVTMSSAPIGSSTWTDHITFKADGTMYPAAGRSWGRGTNPWENIYSKNISLRPPASVNPSTAGEMTFELTSDTQLKVKVRGNDNVTRSATLTLA